MLRGPRCFLAIAALTLTLFAHSPSLFAANSNSPEITWRANKTVDAKLEAVALDKVLARLAALSGWKVFVEPGLEQPVSAQFKNLPQDEALKLLLGELNYALVPQKGAPARLLVYKHGLGDATAAISPDSNKPKNW